jgi:hypothetical protein
LPLFLWDLVELVPLGEHDLRRDAVHPYSIGAGLGCEVLGEDLHTVFAAAYATSVVGCARRATADDIVTMLPVPRAFMPGRKLLG